MIWQRIADKLAATGDQETVRPMIKTSRTYRAPSIGLLGMWCEWVRDADEDDILKAYSHVQRILETLYPNRDSFHVYSIKWRRPVGDRFGKKSDIYYQSLVQLGLTKEESLKRRADYEKKVRHNARNRVERFSKRQVFDAVALCWDVKDLGHQVAAVMLATGSRLIEVLKVSKYSVTDDPGVIKVEGIAKNWRPKTMMRPLLGLTGEQVVNAVNWVRSYKDFAKMENQDAKTAAITHVTAVLRSVFPGHDITSHKCRYIWASLAWQLYGSDVPQQEWVRDMLGHESGDVSLVYLMYKVSL